MTLDENTMTPLADELDNLIEWNIGTAKLAASRDATDRELIAILGQLDDDLLAKAIHDLRYAAREQDKRERHAGRPNQKAKAKDLNKATVLAELDYAAGEGLGNPRAWRCKKEITKWLLANLGRGASKEWETILTKADRLWDGTNRQIEAKRRTLKRLIRVLGADIEADVEDDA